jgi:transcriptional regulator with XRE-family HTH domain
MEVITIAFEINPCNSTNIFRLLRVARDVKVKDLADKLRVTPSYVNAIESGVRTPSTRLIRDYAEALNVDENIILNFSKEANANENFEKVLLSLLKSICE